MNDAAARPLLFARGLIVVIVISSALVFHIRKFDAPSSVVSQQEADAVCATVQRCKKIKFGRAYRADNAVPSLKIKVTADKSGKNPKLVPQIENEIGKLWEAKAHFYSVGWEGKVTEVKYE